MVGRHDLSDAAWEAVRECLPPRRVMGRPPRDPRQVLNGVFWILRTGAPWRDLPECYGPWTTVYFRFREWERNGVIDRMMTQLQSRLDRDGNIDWDLWCIDGTSVRASKAAAGAPKKGAAAPPKTRR